MNDQSIYVDRYLPHSTIHHDVTKKIACFDTEYQHIEVVDLETFGKCLIIDGIFQSSISDEWIYHECLVHPALLFFGSKKQLDILVVGVGPGAPLRELLKHDQRIKKITGVDIDQKAIGIYRTYFQEEHQGSYDHPKVEIVFKSAEEFLSESEEKFDIIISDITDFSFFNLGSNNASEKKFYCLFESHLNDNGIFVTHTTVFDEHTNADHLRLHRTLASIFPRVFSYRAFIPSFFNVWGYLIASKNPNFNPLAVSENTLARRIAQYSLDLRYLDPAVIRSIFTLPAILRP